MRAPDGYHYCGRQASAGREGHPVPAGCAGGRRGKAVLQTGESAG